MKFSSLLPLMLNLCISVVTAQLSTDSRWIVDGSGKRVKLACVNWPSHLETMFAEGLSKQPVDVISRSIISMGFNCVRLTWATFMVTNSSYSSLTVRQSFQALNLIESIGGIKANNPSMLNLTLIEAFKVILYLFKIFFCILLLNLKKKLKQILIYVHRQWYQT
jgi:hypothetical protein